MDFIGYVNTLDAAKAQKYKDAYDTWVEWGCPPFSTKGSI